MGFIEKVEGQQTPEEPDDEDMEFANAHFMVYLCVILQFISNDLMWKFKNYIVFLYISILQCKLVMGNIFREVLYVYY